MEDSIMTEIYCHYCDGYIQVKFNLLLEGRHIVACPKCRHKHLRIIRNGKVTDNIWGSELADGRIVEVTQVLSHTVSTSSVSYSSTSLTTSYWVNNGTSTSVGDSYLAHLWLNRCDTV